MGRAKPSTDDAARAPLTLADLTILDKQQQIVPLRLNRAQQHLIDHLAQPQGGRHLVLKARQLGISTAVQAWLFLTAARQTARIGTLAHDKETTQKLHDMAQFFFDGLPEARQPARSVNTAARTQYSTTHSTVYFGTAGNPRGGRGGTYSHVHGSEVAFWKNGRQVLAGLLQGVPSDGVIVLESTPNGAQGWFYEQVMGSLRGENDWHLHFFPWWWEDGYCLPNVEWSALGALSDDEQRLIQLHGLRAGQIAWRRSKQRELSDLFAQEYPEDEYSAFLKSGDRYFALRPDMFSAPSQSVAIAGHHYVAGLDFGQANDYTVCAVIDATTRQQVDVLRVRRKSWADIRAQVVRVCARWGVDVLVAEGNNMGSTNIDLLHGELAAAGCSTAIQQFQTTHTSKNGILADLRIALDEGGLALLPDPAQQHELEVFSSRQLVSGLWQHAAPPGEHDDCVMALALAVHALGSGSLILYAP